MNQATQEQVVQEQAVVEACDGERLDVVAARLFSGYSRSRLQQWIKGGQLTVNGKKAKPRERLWGGEQLAIEATLEAEGDWQAEAIPLNIVYEDEHLLVLDKPAGLVVHPAAGNRQGTLLNALLNHDEQLATVPRAGIVHRLDKDTTGLMVVARTLQAHQSLVAQLQDKTVYREYAALVVGEMTGGGTVDKPLGRHPKDRKKMAVVEGGKEAVTHYRLAKRFKGYTLLRVLLETGRTHQIRVHMASLQHPLVGDRTYGGRPRLPKGASPELIRVIQQFPRQALHAARLGLEHPATGESMEWQTDLPDDLASLLALLEQDDHA